MPSTRYRSVSTTTRSLRTSTAAQSSARRLGRLRPGCSVAGVDPTATVARTPAQEAVFQPVEPPSTFEETVERLGTAIRLGILSAGTRLPAERDLADQLRISRSTLRQALTTLVQSGHLVSFRGRAGGTFVAKEPPLGQKVDGEVLGEEARAVLDYRVAVETGATVLAAERAGESDLKRLRELTQSMDGAQRFDDYRRADVRFHIGVAEASYSPRLVTAMTEVQGQMSDLIARIAHPEEVLNRSNEQHRRLVALLRRRDIGGAVTLMREHMDGTEHILAGLLPERPG
jgi:GntR family transcriptional regulator, transcriptional repressor for pyruvate dehydrogenase complex